MCEGTAEGKARGAARFIEADRSQTSLDIVDLDGWLPANDRARIVWAFVMTLDLTPLYDAIEAREGTAGRPPPDPRVTLALWLLAVIDGVGSARELDRLIRQDLSYRWLAGGVPFNYHGLSDFRVGNGAFLDKLLTSTLAALLAEGLVELEEMIVDGTKVRASASRKSMRSRTGLAKHEARVAERIKRLREEVDSDPAATSRRRSAARERAAREQEQRIAKARAALDKAEAERTARAKRESEAATAKKPKPRASTSDDEARNMRFADGAMAPGYNVQVATDSATGVILAIKATDRRSDFGLAGTMVDDAERHTGQRPVRLLADTGYVAHDDIIALTGDGDVMRKGGAPPIDFYAPPKPDKADVKAGTLRQRKSVRAREPDAIKAWRARMASEIGRTIAKRRGAIERVNGNLKNRGMGRMMVRGLANVQAVCLLHAIAHNLMTAHRLRTAQPA